MLYRCEMPGLNTLVNLWETLQEDMKVHTKLCIHHCSLYAYVHITSETIWAKCIIWHWVESDNFTHGLQGQTVNCMHKAAARCKAKPQRVPFHIQQELVLAITRFEWVGINDSVCCDVLSFDNNNQSDMMHPHTRGLMLLERIKPAWFISPQGLHLLTFFLKICAIQNKSAATMRHPTKLKTQCCSTRLWCLFHFMSDLLGFMSCQAFGDSKQDSRDSSLDIRWDWSSHIPRAISYSQHTS